MTTRNLSDAPTVSIRARVIALTALVATAAITFGAVSGASAQPRVAAKTVTHYYSLAASALSPDGLHTTTSDYFNQWDPSALSNSDGGRCFNAGLSIPAGPGITMKTVTFYVTEGTSEMNIEVNRQDLFNHTFVDVVSLSSPTAVSPTYTSITKTVSVADSRISNNGYAYSLGVCPSGSSTFSGVTIKYTEPAT